MLKYISEVGASLLVVYRNGVGLYVYQRIYLQVLLFRQLKPHPVHH